MNNDTTTTEPVGSTSNPQASTDNTLGASDSASFQQSAGIDTLKDNRAIQVQPTGKALETTVNNNDMSTAAFVFIIVSSIVLVMIASTVFRWVMKRPEPIKAKKPKTTIDPKVSKNAVEDHSEVEKELAKKLSSAGVSTKRKKKLPRSKRGKK